MQTTLGKRFTDSLREKTEAELEVAKIQIDLFGNINFNGVVGYDHRQDTLFFIERFQAKLVEANKAIQGNVIFKTAVLSGLELKLKQYPGDSLTNLEYFIKALNLNKGDSKADFILEEMAFENGNIQFDLPQFKKFQKLQKLSFKMKQIRIGSQGISVNIDSLSFTRPNGVSIQKFSADITKTQRKLIVDSLRFKTPETKIQGAIAVLLKGKPQDIDTVSLSLSIDELNPKEWGVDRYYSKKITGKIEAKGSLESIWFKKFEIKSEDGRLKSSAYLHLDSLQNFKSIKASVKDLFFEKTVVENSFLLALLQERNIELPPISQVHFSGATFYNADSLTIQGELDSRKQRMEVVYLQNFKKKKPHSISIAFKFKEFDLASYYPAIAIQKMNGSLELNAQKENAQWKITAWNLNLDRFFFKNKKIDSLFTRGTNVNGKVNGYLTVNDSRSKLQSSFLLHTSNSTEENTLQLALENLDLSLFNSLVDEGEAILKGRSFWRFKGTDLDRISGDFGVEDLQILTRDKGVAIDVGDFVVSLVSDGSYRTASVKNSAIINGSLEGDFELSKLSKLFQNTIWRVYPFNRYTNFEKPQYAYVNLHIEQEFLAAAFPKLGIKNDFLLSGLLHSDTDKGELEIEAPIINYNKTLLKGLSLRIEPKEASLLSQIKAASWQINNYKFSNLTLLSSPKEEGLEIAFNARGGLNQEDEFDIALAYTISLKGVLEFKLQPSKITYKNSLWNFSPTAVGAYDPLSSSWNLLDFELSSTDQLIQASGWYKEDSNYQLQAKLQNVSLANLLPNSNKISGSGRIFLDLNSTRSLAKNDFNLGVNIQDLVFNDIAMGQLQFSTYGNNQVGSYSSHLQIKTDIQTLLKGEGTIVNNEQQSNLNFDFDFDSFPLAILDPLSRGTLEDMKGFASGSVNLWGPLTELRHNGELKVTEGSLSIPYLNINYVFDPNTQIDLTDQSFTFPNAIFRNPKFENEALLIGSLSHTNFKNWEVDFEIDTNRILVFDILESPERVFYGQGFFKGNGQLIGPTKSMQIFLDGETANGTNIKIPWSEDYGLVDTSFIDFVSKNQKGEETQETTLDKIDNKVLDMNFELDVTDNAQIEIVIDPETNSSLSGRGVGTLLMEINTDDKFNMWGDFLTTEGIYNFKNFGLIDKKFILQPGGSVNWEGDPLGAQMNMEAVYEVPGGANPAVLLDNPNFNRKIPTEVAIQLQGNLLKPDNPLFSIDFPNTNNIVVSEINYRLADPQRSQLQALSLLSQGVFISDVSVSVQGITNNLYEKASDMFSSLLGQNDEKLKVGVNYLQGERNNELEVETEDRLGLTLSTQLSNRILLNGKIGVPVGGVAQTQVVGDVQIDFILNEEGSLRAKVFNKENEFRYIGQDFGYTQGMGLSYKVDFNSFQDLIQKLKKTKKRDSISLKPSNDAQNSLLQFRSKN